MKLSQYIEDIGASKFAEVYGIDKSYTHKLKTLQHIPSPELARKIRIETHGLVDYEDCYEEFFLNQELVKGKAGEQLELGIK